MKNDKIAAIVIPVYNRAHTIVRCLDSIAMQKGIDRFELIIVDNASTDNSEATVQEWSAAHPEITLQLLTHSKRGAAGARNRGLEAVTEPYVLFFDSDDVMLPGHLDRLVQAIDTYPETDIFGWDITCELYDGRLYRAPFISKNALFNHLTITTFATQRFAARTDLVRSAGGWDGDLSGWDDYELGNRLLLQSPSVMKLKDSYQPLVMTYFTEDSITGRRFSPTPEKWEVALDRIEESLRDARPDLLKVVAFRRAVLAGIYAREGASEESRRLLSKATAPGFGRAKALFCHTFIRTLGRGAGLLSKIVL